ncbi:MAG: DUF1127 domain-containing protein [Thalassovita sp.]
MAYAANSQVIGLNIAARINSAVETFKAARQRQATYAQTVRELESLSNRDLADLGFARSEIKAIAHKTVYDL